MFKCCVCHGKTSRRTSQEEDEEDSSKEVDEDDTSSSTSSSSSSSSSTSSSEENGKNEAKEGEKKDKCQNVEEAVVVAAVAKEPAKKDEEEEDDEDDEDESEDSSLEKKVVVEVNGHVAQSEAGVDRTVIREAIKEEVVEILNNAAQIAYDIHSKGERERLEKIKEESGEESVEEAPSAEESTEPEAPPAEQPKPELAKVSSDETEEEVVTVIEDDEPDEGEYELGEEPKEPEDKPKSTIEEMIIEELINEPTEDETEGVQEQKEIVEQQPTPPPPPTPPASEEPQEEASPDAPEDKQEDEPTSMPTPPPPVCELEIVEEIKKADIRRIEDAAVEECLRLKEERLEQERRETEESARPASSEPEESEGSEKREDQREEEASLPAPVLEDTDLLNIPPPVTPPPEESGEFAKMDEARELDFPTPPPIDFDVAETDREDEGEDDEETDREEDSDRELRRPAAVPPAPPPWDAEESAAEQQRQRLEDYLPVLREQKLCPSPGSKSLPSPPSPGSETGCETEAESKSSSDEQTTTTTTAKPAKPQADEQPAAAAAAADDGPDDDADDSVFEAESLAKDEPPEIKDLPPRPVPPVPRWLSQEEEDDDEETSGPEGLAGMQEPPNTPVARDELALRRHRFFSDLLQAARSTAEHRVSFDPLGPLVHPGCEHEDREEHLEELVNRLESVTKRLEQVSAQQVAPAGPVRSTQEIAVQTKSPSPERSLSIADEPSSLSSESTASAPSVVEVYKTMSVAGYEDIIAGPFQEYLQLSKQIGADVAEHSKLVEKAFDTQLQFIKTAATRPAPSSESELVSRLAPTSTQIEAIQKYRESHRASVYFNHLSAVSESIPALSWVAISPTPAPFVKEMNDAGQYYTNRVLKDWKEKDKAHVGWCQAWVKTLNELQKYVRQHHTTGLVWAKPGSAPAGGVPPPPPPCMMPAAEPVAVNDDRSALFAEINQGENITKNLKKVTSDMQTHKNASLRTGPAPFKAPVVSNNSSGKTTAPANAPIDKQPVFTKDGKKWLVEYHKGNKNLLIDNVEMNNVVYMFRCQDSNLVIKGKINSVVMDSCRKSSVVVDSVVASIEFVNCQSVQMQVLGKVPTISVDKTDGCQMYLNKDTLDVELITSKSSEMNVMVPVGNGDYTEYPIPEQFKTLITDKGLNTTALDSLG